MLARMGMDSADICQFETRDLNRRVGAVRVGILDKGTVRGCFRMPA
jgi:hypothetical protein